MATFDFIPYFKTIAETLKEIQSTATDNHFHRISAFGEMEEFLANSRNITGVQLVVLNKPSGRLDDSSASDNLLDRQFYTYYVLQKVEHGNFNEAQQVRDYCNLIARKIMSKMFIDKRNVANGLLNLDRSSFYYDAIGPVAHGYFGIMCSFSLYNPAGIAYNSDDWTE